MTAYVEVMPCDMEEEKMEEKTLNNSNVNEASKQVSDLEVVGDGDAFALLLKASSKRQGWMKSTKAMNVPGGVLVQVTTQQKNADGSYAVAEALAFVPFAEVVGAPGGPYRLQRMGEGMGLV